MSQYIVLEGVDGTGKTTIARCLGDRLTSLGYDIIVSRQPGSTPLGQHIRKLVKTPHLINKDITIDELSRQILYMVDTISFNKQILEPALEKNINVISDRSSYISSIMYGITSGVKIDEINRLLTLYRAPKIDRLYVITCDHEIAKSRADKRGSDGDVFDNKPSEFYEQLSRLYNNILTPTEMGVPYYAEIIAMVSECVDLDDIRYIDTSNGVDDILDKMVDDLEDNVFK